jgi:hypothetical protein
MGFGDVEDMLFITPDSQEPPHDLWNEDFDDEEMLGVADNEYESDDDLFDAPVEGTAGSWQLLSSPLLTATDTVMLPHNDPLINDHSPSLASNESVDTGKRVPRDRCCNEACKMQLTLTLDQVLGHCSS